MLHMRLLSAEPGELVTSADQQPVAANPEEVRLLGAVSDAASSAATAVVFKGLVGFASISVAGMVTRKFNMGFLAGILFVSGVSFVAASSLKESENKPA